MLIHRLTNHELIESKKATEAAQKQSLEFQKRSGQLEGYES